MACHKIQQEIRQRLHDVVGLAALQIDVSSHMDMTVPVDIHSCGYRRLRKNLQTICRLIPDVACAYTVCPSTEGRLVLTAHSCFPIPPSIPPHTILPSNLLDQALRQRRLMVETQCHLSAGHRRLSACAPLYTPQGQYAGLIGIDIDGDQLRAHQQHFMLVALVTWTMMLPLLLAAAGLLSRRLTVTVIKAQRDLAQHAHLCHLISDISTHLVSVCDEATEAGLKHSLVDIARFTQCDQAYVYLFNRKIVGRTKILTWESRVGQRPLQDITNIDQQLPWLAQHIREQELVQISDVSQLPAEAERESEYYRQQGVKAAILAPLVSASGVLGFIGCESSKARSAWREDEQTLLRVVAPMLARLIEHQHTQQEIAFFNRTMVGREMRILEMKRKVNVLLQALGRPPEYEELDEDEGQVTTPALSSAGEQVEDFNLTDILDIQVLTRILQSFGDLVGIASAIIDLEGNVLARANWQRICTQFHRVHSFTHHRCIESDTCLANQLRDRQDYVIYKCRNGMTDAACPIVIEGRHVANAFVGQFHITEPDIDFFRAQALKLGFDVSDYLQAVHEAPVISQDQLLPVLNFLTSMAEMSAIMGLRRLQAEMYSRSLLRKQLDLQRQRRAALSLLEDTQRYAQALRASEARFRTLVENIPQRIFLKDLNSVFLAVNKHFAAELGLQPEQIVGKTDYDLFPQDLAVAYQAEDRQVMSSGKILDVETQQIKAGQRCFTQTIKVPVRDEYGHVNGVLGIFWDITARKLAEAELRKFKLIFDRANYGSGISDLDGNLLYVNEYFAQIHGYTPDELQGRHLSILHSEQQMVRVKQLIAVLQAQGTVKPTEVWHIHRNGTEFPMLMSAFMFEDGFNSSKYMAATAIDITDYNKTAVAHERLMLAIEQVAEAVVITDVNADIQYANPAFERITGYSREEVLGQNPRILKSGEHDAGFYQEMWAILTSGQIWRGRFINKRKDGTLYTEEATISPVCDAAGHISNYVAVKRDVTHELELQVQLRQAQKMEAIGTLAGGIAHDFNNILNGILGYVELALEDAQDNPVLLDSLKQIEKAGQRATELVRQILTFSRQSGQERGPLQVQFVVKEALKLLRPSLPATIEIRQHIPTTCPPVMADASQIHRVVVNLCTNAYQAMEKQGGVLQVEVCQITITAECEPKYKDLPPGDYVRLTISDTGCGMDAETQRRIFEPYFTTKEGGSGTGLGLASVHGIVTSHGGKIMVTSKLDVGTTFHVLLPVCTLAADQLDVEQLPPPKGNEHILLVDDEQAIVDAAQQFLVRLGYTVTCCLDGAQALSYLQAQPDKFDIMVTDLTMPKMIGTTLAKRSWEIRPDLPIILCTGFPDKMNPSDPHIKAFAAFLHKPVGPRVLALTLRRIFDQRALQ